MLRGPVASVCRGLLVAVLLGASAAGAHAAVPSSVFCGGSWCARAGTVRWEQPLHGDYVIDDDSRGTVPALDDPFAAAGRHVVVLGLGRWVTAFDARTGVKRWTVRLVDVPAAARIVSARAWRSVVTVGLAAPAGLSNARTADRETVLDARTGRLIRSYPSTPFGGAVAADTGHTVVVGPGAVTSYDNATGRPRWSRPTGAPPAWWQLDGHFLYVTVAAGALGFQPVRALRKIDVRSGAQRLIRPPGASFTGILSAALAGVVLFSGPAGVTAYSGNTGRRLWHMAGAVPQGADLLEKRFYLTAGSVMLGVDTRGRVQARLPGSAGLYGERGDVAFGLDQGADGQAWGLDVASQQVVWSTRQLPWPHVFVDLGDLGGSADPRSDVIVLAVCGKADFGVSPPRCAKPELVVIDR